jgi:hypothetical protein
MNTTSHKTHTTKSNVFILILWFHNSDNFFLENFILLEKNSKKIWKFSHTKTFAKWCVLGYGHTHASNLIFLRTTFQRVDHHMCLKTLLYEDCSPTSHISLLFMEIFVTIIMLGLLYHKFIIYKICECKEMKNEVNFPFTIKLNL